MSSAGNPPGAGGASASQRYFCHECNRTVLISPSSSDVRCPVCLGGFVEEFEDTHQPSPNPFIDFPDDPSSFFSAALGGGGASVGGVGFPLIFSSSSTAGSRGGDDFPGPADISSLFGGNRSSSGAGQFQDPDAFNPFHFFQNYLQTLRASGADIQFVIENNSGGGDASGAGGFSLPANLGDYFIGPGLEQLIQQLAENDPNRYGTPPASKSSIEALPQIKVSNEVLASDSSQCAVCKDTFELGSDAKQMPCKHIYHSDCILPWLELHNSCPVCRYELPTDDADYERQGRVTVNPTAVAVGGGGDGGQASQENTVSPRAEERRFRISLPWPFRVFGSSAEASNSNNDNNEGTESNQPEGRQPDRDQ